MRPQTLAREHRLMARDLVEVAAARIAVSLWLLAAGFRAVSDDDYARVTIAQAWALAPKLDPSGTSWLPLPFWLDGAAMVVFGRTLLVAQIVAIGLAVASSLLVVVAVHGITGERRGARIAGHFATLLGWSAWLGVATVPECFTAALVLFGAASLATVSPARRAWGALALLAATLSRYEPWPIAIAFAGWNLWVPAATGEGGGGREEGGREEGERGVGERGVGERGVGERGGGARGVGERGEGRREARSWRACAVRVATSLLALAGPVGWIAWNRFARGDAFEFVARVTAYRRALAAPESDGVLARLVAYPVALVREMPEVMVPAGLVLAVFLAPASRSVLGPRLRRNAPLLALAVLQILALSAALVKDGAPTHHPERAMLFPALALTVFVADAVAGLAAKRPASAPALLWCAGLALFVRAVVTPWGQRAHFVDRESEVAMGAIVANGVPAGDRIYLETTDYGYFAMLARSGRPEDFVLDHDLDPRHPTEPRRFDSDTAQATWLRERGIEYLVSPEPYPESRFLQKWLAATGKHALFRVPPAVP